MRAGDKTCQQEAMNRAGALLVALAALQLVLGGPCPCSDPSLCKVLQIPPRKEVFGFQVSVVARESAGGRRLQPD